MFDNTKRDREIFNKWAVRFYGGPRSAAFRSPTLKELAAEYNLTPARIHQIVSKKIRNLIKKNEK